MYLALIFPILITYFPECEGKGSFLKPQIKSLVLLYTVFGADWRQSQCILFAILATKVHKQMREQMIIVVNAGKRVGYFILYYYYVIIIFGLGPIQLTSDL